MFTYLRDDKKNFTIYYHHHHHHYYHYYHYYCDYFNRNIITFSLNIYIYIRWKIIDPLDSYEENEKLQLFCDGNDDDDDDDDNNDNDDDDNNNRKTFASTEERQTKKTVRKKMTERGKGFCSNVGNGNSIGCLTTGKIK